MKSLLTAPTTEDGDGIPTITDASLRRWLVLPLRAPGTNIVSQYAAGAIINDTTGPFVMTLPTRTIRCVLGVGGANPVSVTITGTDYAGNPLTETIVCTGAGTYEGEKAFDAVSKVQTNVDPGGTLDVRTGLGVGLGVPMTALVGMSVDGTVESAASVDVNSATVVPTTTPNSSKVFAFLYTSGHNHEIG